MDKHTARSYDSSARVLELRELLPHLPMEFVNKSKRNNDWVTFRGQVVKSISLEKATPQDTLHVVYYNKFEGGQPAFEDVGMRDWNHVILYEPSDYLQLQQRCEWLEDMVRRVYNTLIRMNGEHPGVSIE